MENVNHQVLDLVPQKHSQIVDPTGGCFTRSIKHQRLPDKVEEVKEGGAGGARDVSLSPQRCRELQPGVDWGFAHRTHNTQHATHPTDADSVLYSESCVCCVVLPQRCRWTSGLQSSRWTCTLEEDGSCCPAIQGGTHRLSLSLSVQHHDQSG